MNNSSLATVLISVYNGATTLDRCLESLLAQTRQDFSILVINDASTDGTPGCLSRWQATFGDQLRIVENDINLGLTRSLNRGLGLIETPYTARLDADDWWSPKKLEQQLAFLETHPQHGVVGSAYANIIQGREKIVRPPIDHANILAFMFYRNPFAHSAVLFRTKTIQEAGGYDETIYYGQDYELWLRIAHTTRFANLDTVLCFRSCDRGISHETQSAQMWQFFKTQLRYLWRYRRPISDYRYLIEPLLVIIAPEWLKRLKRKYV